MGAPPAWLVLRPVWLIGDLQILYEWLRSPVKKSNWSIPPQGSLFQHYHYALSAHTQQSLLVADGGIPIIQFDLGPVAGDPQTVDIKYLFRQYFRDPPVFDYGLALLLQYFRSLETVFHARVVLPGADQSMESILLKTGFQPAPPDPERPRAISFACFLGTPEQKSNPQCP